MIRAGPLGLRPVIRAGLSGPRPVGPGSEIQTTNSNSKTQNLIPISFFSLISSTAKTDTLKFFLNFNKNFNVSVFAVELIKEKKLIEIRFCVLELELVVWISDPGPTGLGPESPARITGLSPNGPARIIRASRAKPGPG